MEPPRRTIYVSTECDIDERIFACGFVGTPAEHRRQHCTERERTAAHVLMRAARDLR